MKSIFLCNCVKYADERNELYSKVRYETPDLTEFDDREILCYLQKYHQKALSKFICDAWSLRQKHHFK